MYEEEAFFGGADCGRAEAGRAGRACEDGGRNTFLSGFVQRFNERFALTAAKPENLHRPLNVKANRLTDILCHREQRHVSDQLTLSYDRKQIILERSDLSEKLAGQYVEVYDFAGRNMEVRWKGHSLPYRVFTKDQRVSHTAIVEKKTSVWVMHSPSSTNAWARLCQKIQRACSFWASAFNPLDDPFGVFGLILWVYKDLALPRSPHENATTYSSPATFRHFSPTC